MFEGPVELINKAKKILLLTHKEAGGDGDALGSLLGLSFALSKLEKKIYSFLDGEISSNFSFLPGLEMLDGEITDKLDLLILLDFAELQRGSWNGREKLIKKIPSILIDHHPKGNLYNLSTFKMHDQKAASTTEIVYFLIDSLKVPIDKEIATSLLLGIFTDTNSFQNPNTTTKTFTVASSLLSYGARIEKIAKHTFYEKSLGILKLWGKAMSRLWKNEKYDLLVTTLTAADFRECGIGEEGSNGIANFLSLTSSAESAGILVLVEENGKIKGSLRTQKEGIDVCKLASALGGGGHQKAAGFTVEGKLGYDKGRWRVD